MRILYIQQHFAAGTGTAGVRGWNLVRTMVRRGHEVTVLSGHNWRDAGLAPDASGRPTEERTSDGYTLVRLPVFYSNHQGFVARVRSFFRYAREAEREALRRPADLVYASSTPLTVSLPAMAVLRKRGTPYVFEVRDLWPELPAALGIIRNPLLLWGLRRWERTAYRRAHRLVGLAPGIVEGIAAAGVPRERIAMVPNGSDTDGIRPRPGRPRTLLPVGDDAVVFGFTGTHGPANGLDAVLDGAAELKRRGDDRARFVLVGDGRDKAALVERARRESLHNVLFLDLVGKDRYPDLLAEMDVGMQILRNCPAFYRGTSPNKFFDYLAAGRPVLVNYPGWMTGIVEESRCGRGVAPDDAAAFADGVQWFCESADRAAMGAAARRVAEERFAQSGILDGLMEFVEASMAEPAEVAR